MSCLRWCISWGLRHAFFAWLRGLALVQFFGSLDLFASFGAVTLKLSIRCHRSLSDVDPNPYQPPRPSHLDDESNGASFVLSGCLTVEDVLTARRLAIRGFWPRIILGVSIISLFLIVLIVIAFSSRPSSSGTLKYALFVACVVFPTFLIGPFLLGRFSLHRSARVKRGVFAPIHLTFSPEGVIATSANSKSEIKWPLFSHCVSNDSVALIYYSNSKQHLILARSTLESPDQWDDFISMIHRVLEAPSGT